MVPLGWVRGVVGLIDEFEGKRRIRYKDLVGFIYGRKAYSLTWGLQYINLFMINVRFIILAGSTLKVGYTIFKEEDPIKLSYAIAFARLDRAIFSIAVPDLSALKFWMWFSTFFSLVYIVIAIVLSLKDGIKAPSRDYTIVEGSSTNKIFTIIGASANLVFAFST